MPDNASNTAPSFIRALFTRGVTLLVRNGRIRMEPPSAYRELSDEELLVFRHHRAEIKALVEAGAVQSLAVPTVAETTPTAPAPQRQQEPEPEVHVYGIRLQEHDVIDSLRALGDEVLASYHSGELARSKAYAIAAHRLRQWLALR